MHATNFFRTSALMNWRTVHILFNAGSKGRPILQQRISRPSILVRRVGNAQVRLTTLKPLLPF